MGVFGVVLAVPIAVIFSIVFPLPKGKQHKEENQEKSEKRTKSAKITTLRKKQ